MSLSEFVRRFLFALLFLVAVEHNGAAQSPKTEPLSAQIATLTAKVDELAKLAAEVSALSRVTADLSGQIAGLRTDLDGLARGYAAEADERRHLDELETRVGELARAVSSLRVEFATARTSESSAMPGGATYRDGFILATDDGRFALRTKGYVLFRHLVRRRGEDLAESSIIVKQARLAWDGTLYSPKLAYKLMAEFAQPAVSLLDVYVEGAPIAGFTLRGGQFKVPFSRSFLTSDEMLSFIERPVATDEFSYDRDVGLLLSWHGAGNKVEAGAGIWNGAGRNVKANDNLDPLVLGRVTVAVLGKLWRPEDGDFDTSPTPQLLIGAAASFENAPIPRAYGYGSGGQMGRALPIAMRDLDTDGRDDNVRVVQANAE